MGHAAPGSTALIYVHMSTRLATASRASSSVSRHVSLEGGGWSESEGGLAGEVGAGPGTQPGSVVRVQSKRG